MLALFCLFVLPHAEAARNAAPVARNDAFTVNEDILLSVAAPGVLGNDTDSNQDPLTAILVSQPGNGTLTFNADGSFTYTPNANFHGQDSFSYKANDGRTDSPVATVTITVNPINDPPVAANDSYSVLEDELLKGDALENDTDVDIEFLKTSTSATSIFLSPTHGRVSMSSDGSFGYSPSPNFNGTDSFLYQVQDGSGGVATGTVTITVTPVNDAPVALNLSRTALAVAPPLVANPVPTTLAGSDVDGDALTFRVETQPAHGILSGTPPNLSYTPISGYAGDDSFTYTVSDGSLRSSPATVRIDVLPTIAIRAVTSVAEGNPLFCVPATGNPVAFTVELNVTSTKSVSFNLRVRSDGAARPFDDYTVSFVDHQDAVGFVTRQFQIPATATRVIVPALVTTRADCVCEPDEPFVVEILNLNNAVTSPTASRAQVFIRNDDTCIGTTELIPAQATVAVGERLNYGFVWTHPEQWRKLETMDLRISDDEGVIFHLHWNEPGNTFRLINSANGEPGPESLPGSPLRLETSAATLHLAESSVIGSGPTGLSVLLDLSLSFKPQAAGRTYRVEAFATDDFGHQQGWEPVGTLTVTLLK